MKKQICYPQGVGTLIVPISSEENMHEFGLFDIAGNLVKSSYFKDLDRAVLRAKEEYPSDAYTVKDLTEKWYIETALRYRKRIRQLHPSFRTSSIILDLSKMYYGRNPDNWYTFIPFTYKGVQWEYRESAGGDWIQKQ